MTFVDLDNAGAATGTVVVMDVLRAFTTAAYAFGRGAERIVMVADVAEALRLHTQHPDWLLMGEVRGRRIDGFHLSNSPFEINSRDLAGRTIVQRTSAGTQGISRAVNATKLLCGNVVCASATARVLSGEACTYVKTEGDEDLAGAEFIEALRHGPVDATPFVDRVRASRAGMQLLNRPEIGVPEDVDLATDVDRFDFAIQVRRTELGLVAAALF